jgi:hypothetical protein
VFASFKTLLTGRFLFLCLLFSNLLLAGCQTTPPQLQIVKDAWQSSFSSKPFSIDQLPLEKLPKGYEYALINSASTPAVMVLGERIKGRNSSGEYTDEHWYSATGELLVLRDGRFHTVFGMPTEWRANRSAPPAWSSFEAQASTQHWVRTRDEMPNYRYGLQDHVASTALAEPPKLEAKALELSPPKGPQVLWVQDQVKSTKANGTPWTYTQRFALENKQVVYSEQCISPTLCFRFRKIKTP